MGLKNFYTKFLVRTSAQLQRLGTVGVVSIIILVFSNKTTIKNHKHKHILILNIVNIVNIEYILLIYNN